MRKTRLVFMLFVLVLCLSACGCEHEWSEATCTEPQTCSLCGETQGEVLEHKWVEATCEKPKYCELCNIEEGEALGHDYLEATCTKPKICSVCEAVSGEALGHSVNNWEIVTDSTCAEKGISEGVCENCQNTLTDEVPLKEHTPGEWVVTTEATESASGERTQNCTVCSAVIATEEYELSEEEKEALYKNKCTSYSYNDIARLPDQYDGEYARFYGKVLQVMPETIGNIITYTLRIGTGGSYYYDNVILASYTTSKDEPRILEDDMITVYGELAGEYTYETVRGDEITIPLMYIEYVD